MSAFDGLRLYEIVMLVLGIVLFITTIVLMVYLITRKRSIKPLTYLFLLSIVMMGFPAISKIQFQGAVVDLKNRVEGEGSTTPDSTVREPLEVGGAMASAPTAPMAPTGGPPCSGPGGVQASQLKAAEAS